MGLDTDHISALLPLNTSHLSSSSGSSSGSSNGSSGGVLVVVVVTGNTFLVTHFLGENIPGEVSVAVSLIAT